MKTRSYEKEIMDEFSTGGEVMDQTLRELRFINKWLGGNKVTLQGLTKLFQHYNTSSKTLQIADLGCGGGDMLICMSQWVRKRQQPVQFTGIDANEYIVGYAQKHTFPYPEISYLNLDVFSDDFRQLSYDIVTGTLFCHHFTDEQLISLFRNLKQQVRVGIVINDLHRHWFAYHSIKWLTRWFSRSEMVRYDAKLSVKRGFLRSDWERILNQAGIKKYELTWCWAFRWRLVIFA
ncbi:methyltransferase domain-containing protein [Xanthocytophaga agilis]|uniref:Methyltransferase domain-containing protein n=1 Tax=Xanthocytophaga agilis TaxID=3048010 RepID=A0AAE3RAA9_9BACT|nr:methyltransferase domain-containing protein [Xanthocytophaga agilis]MDJ1506846.1 methyltransferase domain-containing protein [Xanthocytophaga agilis]